MIRTALAAAVLALPLSSLAGTPASGTLSPDTPVLNYTTAPFSSANPTPVPEVDDGPRCNATTNPCDSYQLTVSLPAGYAAAHPKDKIRITVAWTPQNLDMDLWVFLGMQGDTNGASAGFKHIASDPGVPEVLDLDLTSDLSKVYTIKIVPYAAAGATATGKIELISPPPPPPDSDGDGVADPDDACADTPAGSLVDAAGCPVQDVPELPLHFHGNTHEKPESCSGAGNSDFVTCGGPFLFESATLDSAPAAHFDYAAPSGTNGQGPYDANWTWTPTAPVTVQGYTVVNFWAACNGDCVLVGGKWDLRLFKNNTVKVFEALQLPATPSSPNVPSLLSVNVRLPAIALNGTTDTLTLKLEAHFTDTGSGSSIYYDSTQACPGASGSKACDSIVIFNAKAPPPPPPPPPPTPPSGLEPRYQIHVSPAGLGDDAGEPSVGVHWTTKHSMFISYTSALRQTYQEDVNPPLLPASCPALWEDKSGTLTTVNSLDPILFTDEVTGRTYNSQLSGDNSLMEYTDDDGETWKPAQKGPPNGGADHQAVATGFYPAGKEPATAAWPASAPKGKKRAVYYCSQSVAGAFCSRSDDGGDTFGPGFPFKNTDCAAGALHGHVKVAPDGTVYVPDSSQCALATGGTADHVVAFASDDAGQTWSVRDVPFSSGGDASDPSIGIATDGTLYMCYPDADATVHVAWSSDKGKTWEGGQDIGAALGLKQTRFPQMIAGDPDRASCAFLGTTGARPESPSNDGYSLDFEGVWYGYVATTYDHGKSWHLVNVTPNDPVQGWGGIGTSGTNRNLLDFNDLQIDSEGRTYFAFADGCINGCVKDPSANPFAAKATIVRQTGGRTLFAAYDNKPLTRYNNPAPILPAAACARADLSVRSPVEAKVVWNAPDTGGAPIDNYKVYRGLDPAGPFSFVGDAGPKNSLTDTTAKPAVEKYYYNVVAYNSLGAAPVSNTIELPINAVVVDTCTLPGETIALDATGDGVANDTDIEWIAVAEPAAYKDYFVITEKIVKFTAGQPPADSFYPILFPTKGSVYVSLDATQGVPKFTYGTYTTGPQGVLVFSEKGALHADSKYLADGTIRMIVPRSLFGDPAVGGVISGFDARVRVGAQSATSRDTAGPSDYTVRGTDICNEVAVQPVLAALNASVTQGQAPLDVNFTLSGRVPQGKTLGGYSILFGDEPGPNPAATTGTFDGQGSMQVPHTYAAEGVYRARLTITDSSGAASGNPAEQTITVLAGPNPVSGSNSTGLGNNTVGGALPAQLLAVFGALALLGRRAGKCP